MRIIVCTKRCDAYLLQICQACFVNLRHCIDVLFILFCYRLNKAPQVGAGCLAFPKEGFSQAVKKVVGASANLCLKNKIGKLHVVIYTL